MSRYNDHPDDAAPMSLDRLARINKGQWIAALVIVITAVLIVLDSGLNDVTKSVKAERLANAKQFQAISASLTAARQQNQQTQAELTAVRNANDSLAKQLSATNRRVSLVATALDTVEVLARNQDQELVAANGRVDNLSIMIGKLDKTIAQFQAIPATIDTFRLQVSAVNDRLAIIDARASSGIDQLRSDLRRRDWNKTGLWAINLSTLAIILSHVSNHGGQ